MLSQPDKLLEIGPQCASDPPFKARMRFHQSWYRARILKVPFGTGPGPKNSTPYGNMLTHADGVRALNFLTPQIHFVAEQRLEEGQGKIEPFRLRCNMLSSQPMCFNLFGPLVDDLDLATRLFQALLPGEIKAITRVTFEFAPKPASNYLNDRTAFDAFVAYIRTDGQQGFVGIETKLTETFSPRAYDKPIYRKWTERPGSPWSSEAWPQVADIRHNQLWRDHLLVESLRHNPHSGYAVGRLMLVYHPNDHTCSRVVANYKTLLRPNDDTFVDVPLDRLVKTWAATVDNSPAQQWLSSFYLRYLDLSASENEI